MNRNTEKITVRGLQFPISRALPVNRKISQEVKNPLIFFDCDLGGLSHGWISEGTDQEPSERRYPLPLYVIRH